MAPQERGNEKGPVVAVRCASTKPAQAPVVGEDQHGNNTDETAFPGTRRHDC